MDPEQKITEEKYADMIHMERPGADVVCGKHPRMANAERAKIFAPFAALRGYSERLSVEVGKQFLKEDKHIQPGGDRHVCQSAETASANRANIREG